MADIKSKSWYSVDYIICAEHAKIFKLCLFELKMRVIGYGDFNGNNGIGVQRGFQNCAELTKLSLELGICEVSHLHSNAPLVIKCLGKRG